MRKSMEVGDGVRDVFDEKAARAIRRGAVFGLRRQDGLAVAIICGNWEVLSVGRDARSQRCARKIVMALNDWSLG